MKEASELALSNLEDGAEAVNWHIEVIKTHPPKVKLKRRMVAPSCPADDQGGSDNRNQGDPRKWRRYFLIFWEES
jgi:hypothetical protein